jgi:WD40 repeat protein
MKNVECLAVWVLAAGLALGQASVDSHGEPLPAGAIARMGTVRWRHGTPVSFVGFLPGDKAVISAGFDQIIHVWDARTGTEVRRFGKAAGQPEEVLGAIAVGGGRGRQVVRRRVNTFVATLCSNGKRLVTCGDDAAVRVWEVETGKEVCSLSSSKLVVSPNGPYGARPAGLAVTADGSTLAVRGMDGAVSLWDVATSERTRQLEPPRAQRRTFAIADPFSSLAFSPDGKVLASAWKEMESDNRTYTATYQLRDVATGKTRYELKDETQAYALLAIGFSPDGAMLARTGLDGSIHLARADTGADLHRLETTGPLMHFTFSPDGKTLAVTNQLAAGVQLWDTHTGARLRTLLEPEGLIFQPVSARNQSLTSIAFARDGSVLAVARDRSLRLLDPRSGRHVQSVYGHEAPIARLQFSPDGRWLTTKAEDGSMFVWDSATGKERDQIQATGAVTPGAFLLSPNGETLAVAAASHRIEFRSLAGRDSRAIDCEKTGYSGFVFSPDGQWLAVQESTTPNLHLYSVESGKEVRHLEAPPGEFDAGQGGMARAPRGSTGLLFSPDGSRLAAVLDGSKLGVWDTSTGKWSGQVPLQQTGGLKAIAFAPNDRALAMVGTDNSAALWEIATGQLRRTFGDKAADADDPRQALIARERRIRILAGAAGPVRAVFSLYSEAGTALAYSLDGRFLYLPRPDKTIAVLEVSTAKEHARLAGHQGEVTSLALAPDGKRLASGSADTTALVWNVDSFNKEPRSVSAKLAAADVEKAWPELGSLDAAKAFDAMCLMASAPALALPCLQKNLRAADTIPPAQIDQWIADLDNDHYKMREQADQELEKIGELAEEALWKALNNKPTPEARERIELLLKKARKVGLSSASLRDLRAIELLEMIGTPEARQLLHTLAAGGEGALKSRAAQESLRRLERERK